MKLIAHRVLDDHKYQENSIEGYKYCINKNYIDGLEIDVRLTKDNKFVVHHNFLNKIKIISSSKYKELNNIPLLEDFLKIKHKKILLLDLKLESNNIKDYAQKLIKMLKRYKLNYYLCTFNYSLGKYLATNTDYKVGLFVTDIINKNKDYKLFDFVALSKNSYDDINFKTKMIWTINKPLKNKKYDFVITDKAYLLSK